MNLIQFLLSRSWRLVGLSIVVGIFSGLASAGIIAFVNAAMDSTVSSAIVGWSFLGLAIVVVTSKAFSELLLVRLGQEAVADLRMHLSREILSAPLRHLEQLGQHRLLATLNDDADVIANAYVHLPIICINAATVLGCLAYLGWLSWPLLVATLILMGIGAVMFLAYQRKAFRYFKDARETNDTLFHNFRSILTGIKELKLHRERRHAFITTVLHPTVTAYKRNFLMGMWLYLIASSWGMFLFYGVIGGLLFVLAPGLNLPLATVTGAMLVVLYMMGPFAHLMEMLQSVGRANVALRKVHDLGLSLAESRDMENGTKASAPAKHGVGSLPDEEWQRLQLIRVTHRYYREHEEGSFCLGPIDLTVSRGEIVFLIGGNGSGKTSLALLLLGLYTPESGEIRIDDTPIDGANREQYRQLFSAVFSDFHLFETLLGLSHHDLDGQARAYLDRFQLSSKVSAKDGVLSTLALSQGQRKRLALLTAYLEDRPIYIFDEWAADQDPIFRKVFYTELLPDLKARGKTVFVITHDDHYFFVGDRCIRMDFGQITNVADRKSHANGSLAGSAVLAVPIE
ncbi:MAG: cyclic peptide export ABC transporter [Nitrospira sp.]|nr:cyclic peptide export ABC transporter [Nitrospira sp.]